ncbi:MAG: pyridoxamine 5'-phosphate oxidase family protein [Desulfohalobiaceae bacterium]|nr:pyridoxamine 5'-phosphate oxidase family protein [Desulfohalobiaceae bacterium]
MRRQEKSIHDSEALRDLLRRGRVCRLGLVDRDRAYIVPMNYGYADNCLYFHSAKEGKKVDLLQNGGHVCFEVDLGHALKPGERGCDWTMHFQSVIGYGRVRFLETDAEKRTGLGVIMAQYAPGSHWEFSESDMKRVLVFKLTIEEMSGKASSG